MTQFEKPHDLLLVFCCKNISIFYHFQDTITYLRKIRGSVTFTTPVLGAIC